MLYGNETRRVRFEEGHILIDGQPKIVLCSSLFYFRIPRGLWRQRMRAIRDAGYNCIDVYMPWNNHEPAQGRWDFGGERDIAAFLQLAAEEGLWVLARPGPYICSEWDGGGLPAYLLAERDIRLRDNDAGYLRHVTRWFDQILPIISQFQLGTAGTVIALQLENELDFYDCRDPRGYLEALREMALAHSIQVPLIACAGQGDIHGATGNTPGIVPACNFYPDDRDPGVEARVAPYQALLNAQGWPLIVTETNRAHFLLRRLLSSGAKLLGPYLQASGFNFGFTNGINNWGDPLAFMSSDYDFGGMIGPYGELRAEISEARRLSRMIGALGSALAAATPTTAHGIAIETALALVEDGPHVLALAGGGLLLALPNLGTERGQVRLRYQGKDLPAHSIFTVQPDRCPFVLFDLPLAPWLVGAAIAYSTAALCAMRLGAEHAVLAFSGAGEVELVLPGVCAIEATGIAIHRDGDRLTLCFDPPDQGRATIQVAAGKSLRVQILSPERAANLLDVTPPGDPVFIDDQPSVQDTETATVQPLREWSAVVPADAAQALVGAAVALGDTPIRLEEAGIGHGFGWYEAQIEVSEAGRVRGFLLHEADDVVSLYWGDRYQGTVVPGGASCVLPAGNIPAAHRSRLAVRAEIWGHSNFDDSRLPGLRLTALKGVAGITAITSSRSISGNWRWYPGLEPGTPLPPSDPGVYSAPVIAWGGWQTTRIPDKGLYVKEVRLSPAADSWVLQFAGTEALVQVWVNDRPCGLVNRLNPFVNLTEHVRPGALATITLAIERWHGESAGKVTLLEGRRATNWSLRGGGEQELWSAATQAAGLAGVAGLPYRLPAGGVAWLFATVDELAADGESWTLHLDGRNAKLTAFFNGHGAGRIWLPSAGRPPLRGGNNNALYLPAPWFQQGANLLALLVEAVTQDEDAEISAAVAQCRPVLTMARS
jgi:beta-galactosidase